MNFTAVTTYAERHWQSHAKRCVDTFKANWVDVPLLTFTDEELTEQCSWLVEFKARHAHRPTANYRYDAVRFAHKVAAIDLAYSRVRSGILIWMDADCVTHSPVDHAWLSGLLGEADFGYLDRVGKYPECGFMMFRVSSFQARALVWRLVRLYQTDDLFALREWHDSYAIEHCRKSLEGLQCASLSGAARTTGHPLVNGPLGAKLDHLKGTRKQEGRSRRSDLKGPRAERYWA